MIDPKVDKLEFLSRLYTVIGKRGDFEYSNGGALVDLKIITKLILAHEPGNPLRTMSLSTSSTMYKVFKEYPALYRESQRYLILLKSKGKCNLCGIVDYYHSKSLAAKSSEDPYYNRYTTCDGDFPTIL